MPTDSAERLVDRKSRNIFNLNTHAVADQATQST